MASLALVMVLLTGCGNDATPAEAVPELSHRLEQVDAALAAGQPNKAREAIDALLDEAAQARVDGDLSADQADRIMRAATELIRALKETDGQRPTDPSTSSPSPSPDVSGDEDQQDTDENDAKEEEDKKKKSKSEGNGPSKGNGPDDGHGNQK